MHNLKIVLGLLLLLSSLSCGLPLDNESACANYVELRNSRVESCYTDLTKQELEEQGKLLDTLATCVGTDDNTVDCVEYYDCLLTSVECTDGAVVIIEKECGECA